MQFFVISDRKGYVIQELKVKLLKLVYHGADLKKIVALPLPP
jgi:hypothetical protein